MRVPTLQVHTPGSKIGHVALKQWAIVVQTIISEMEIVFVINLITYVVLYLCDYI